MGLMLKEDCKCDSESFKDKSSSVNFGFVNMKSDLEKEMTYNSWGKTVHWTDFIEVILVILAFLVILRKIVGCLRSKVKQNKSKKIEALKTIFDSQQTQRVNQQPLASPSLPTMMVMGNPREIHDNAE